MGDATSPELAELAEIETAAPPRISIEGTRMLTGMVGFACLYFSWFLVVVAGASAAMTAYDMITGGVAGSALETLGAAGVCLIVAAIMRWTARSVLAGSKVRAVVACVLIVIYAGVTTTAVLSGEFEFDKAMSIAFAILCVVFTGLLVASFRDRRYWSGQT